jgi:predicted Zn-dependent protease
MKTTAILSLLLAIIALAGCSSVPETGRRQLIMVSAGDEAKMGLSSFDDIKKQEKISTDANANAQVQRVGQRIAGAVGRDLPNAQWEFVVFDSEQVNAFALPGGKVGVYTGLLKLVASDDELACVMGHEIAHVSSRHGAERVSQNMLAGGVSTIGSLALDFYKVAPATRDTVMGLYGAGVQVGALLPFSRLHETEADTIGLKFAAGAGYDPRAAAAFWKKMAAKSSGSSTPAWLSTHPSDQSRIDNLEKLAPQHMPLYENARKAYQGK